MHEGRYATKLMSFLFTEEEMIGGLIGPIERKTTKTELYLLTFYYEQH